MTKNDKHAVKVIAIIGGCAIGGGTLMATASVLTSPVRLTLWSLFGPACLVSEPLHAPLLGLAGTIVGGFTGYHICQNMKGKVS